MSSQARHAGDNQRAMAILEEGMRRVPPADSRGRASLCLSLAFMRLDRGELESAKALLGDAGALRDTPLYFNAFGYAGMVAGDPDGFRSNAVAQVRACASAGDDTYLRARFNVGFGLTILGLDRDALQEFAEILPDLRRNRLSSLEVLACANTALIHARAGRLDEGRDIIERAAGIPVPATTGPIALAAAALTVGFALCDQRLVDRCYADDLLEAAFASGINSTLGRIVGPLARWLESQGNASEAQLVLRRAAREIRAPFGATETILAAAEIGDEGTRGWAFAFLDSLEVQSNLPIHAATLRHLQALRAWHAGRGNDTAYFAREARCLYEELGWNMHVAQCDVLCGEPKRAVAAYRKLRAPGNLRSIEPALSAREREIAALVAGGTANQVIAERLRVNQRTVEKHLTSIYTKLGLRNRSELAAFITRTKS